MFIKIKGMKILWFITALLAIAASLIGIINPNIYKGLVEYKYLPGTISQDYVALLAGALLMFIAIRMSSGKVAMQVVGLGLLGFLFYGYGIFTIEQVYNVFYLMYMAIFSLAFFSIVYSLVAINQQVLATLQVPEGVRKVSVWFSFLIPLVFCPLWIMMLIPLITTGNRVENIFSVFILDLCFIMPVFVILAVMAIRKNKFSLLLTPSLYILGFTLLFPVGFAEAIKPLYNMDLPLDIGSAVMYCGIAIVFLVLSIIYLKKISVKVTHG